MSSDPKHPPRYTAAEEASEMSTPKLEADAANLRFLTKNARAKQAEDEARAAKEAAALKAQRDSEQRARAEGILARLPKRLEDAAKRGMDQETVMQLVPGIDFDRHHLKDFLVDVQDAVDKLAVQRRFLIGAGRLVHEALADSGMVPEVMFGSEDGGEPELWAHWIDADQK